MFKKRILGAAMFLAFATLAVGCAPTVNETTPEPTKETETPVTTETPDAQSKDEVVEITFWNFPNFATIDDTPGKYEEEMIAAFEAKNPNIKVKLEMISFNDGPAKINTAIETKTAPDVVYDAPGRVITWAKNGVLAPITDLFTSEIEADMDPSVLSASKHGSDYYLYPINTAPFMMAFNKTMLEELGLLEMLPLDKENRAWTVEEYEALLSALKDAGKVPAIFYSKSSAGDQGTRAFISNLYNSWITNDDLTEYTINNEAGVKALTWTAEAINKGLMVNGSALAASDTIDEFVAGRAASTLLFSPGLLNTNQPNMDFEPVFMPYPNSGGEPVLEFLIGGPCVFDNGDAAKVEASKIFIDFMANDSEWGVKNILSTGSFAARNSVTDLYDDPELQFNAKMTAYYGTYYNTINGYDEMRTLWFPMLQDAVNGGDVQAALDNFVEQSNAAIK
ncbi:MAG: ABC transporter substrate-binding protein [Turicibacter sp.]